MMTTEELLRPRRKVIDIFPYNERFPLGMVIEFEPWASSSNYWIHKQEKDCQGEHEWLLEFFDTYPNLFAPVPWYEGRKPEDLPKKLKGQGDKPSIYEVEEYYLDKTEPYIKHQPIFVTFTGKKADGFDITTSNLEHLSPF